MVVTVVTGIFLIKSPRVQANGGVGGAGGIVALWHCGIVAVAVHKA